MQYEKHWRTSVEEEGNDLITSSLWKELMILSEPLFQAALKMLPFINLLLLVEVFAIWQQHQPAPLSFIETIGEEETKFENLRIPPSHEMVIGYQLQRNRAVIYRIID